MKLLQLKTPLNNNQDTISDVICLWNSVTHYILVFVCVFDLWKSFQEPKSVFSASFLSLKRISRPSCFVLALSTNQYKSK